MPMVNYFMRTENLRRMSERCNKKGCGYDICNLFFVKLRKNEDFLQKMIDRFITSLYTKCNSFVIIMKKCSGGKSDGLT